MTPPTPSRYTPAGRAYNDLRNLARRQNRDPAEYMTLYALEASLLSLVTMVWNLTSTPFVESKSVTKLITTVSESRSLHGWRQRRSHCTST